MDNRDIWRAANLLIQQHGPDAVFHTFQRADDMLACGNVAGTAAWLRIYEAVHELLRERPGNGKMVQ